MSSAQSKQSTLSVYLVDDSKVVRQSLTDLFSLTPGVEICGTADCVTSALAGVAETNPDVVVVDLNLPDGTGLDVLKAVRTQVPKAVVIVLTMHSFHDLGSRCLEAGAQHFFEKMGDLEPLLKVIAGLAWRKNPKCDSFVAGSSAVSLQKTQTHEVLLSEAAQRCPECIAGLDGDARLLWINHAGQGAMGLTPGAVASRPRWVEFFDVAHRCAAKTALTTAKTAGVARFSASSGARSGTPKWWDIGVTAILNDSASAIAFLVVSRDVTFRRAAVAQLNRQLDELETDAPRRAGDGSVSSKSPGLHREKV